MLTQIYVAQMASLGLNELSWNIPLSAPQGLIKVNKLEQLEHLHSEDKVKVTN